MAGLYEADIVSKKLDKADAIIRAYDNQAHFLATVKRGKPLKDVMAMWTVDELGDPVNPATAEGADATGTPSHHAQIPLYGRAEIFRSERWMVTRTAEAVEATDVIDEVVRQRMKKEETFLLSIERALLSFQEAVASGTRKTRGLMQWANSSAQSVDPVDSGLRPTSAMRHTTALDALTETVFKNMLGAARDQLRQKPVLVGKVGWRLKSHMTAWGKVLDLGDAEAALQRYNVNAAEKKLMSMIDFFEFDTGSVRTMISDYLACDTTTLAETDYTPRSGIFYMPDRVSMRWLRPIEHYEQDDEGGGRRGYYEGEGMLQVQSPQGFLTVYTDADTTT